MKFVLMVCFLFQVTMAQASAKIPSPSFFHSSSIQNDSIPKSSKKKFKFRQSPIIGTSFTLIPDDYFPGQVGTVLQHELIWSLNMAIPLNHRWDLGLNYMSIISFGGKQAQRINWMAGPFSHFKAFSNDVGKIYIESALYMGNLCQCYPEFYTVKNQFYFSAGAGGEVFLSKRFSIDVAMISTAAIIGELENAQAAGLYIFGINYQF